MQEYAGILFIASNDQVNGIQLRICGTPVMDRRYRWSGLAVLRPRNIQFALPVALKPAIPGGSEACNWVALKAANIQVVRQKREIIS